jgi:hypothetical protein
MKLSDLILVNNDMLVKEPFIHPNHVDRPTLAGTPAMKKSSKEIAEEMAGRIMTGLEVVSIPDYLKEELDITIGDFVLPEGQIQSFTYIFEDGEKDILGRDVTYLKVNRQEVWAVVKQSSITPTSFKKPILIQVTDKK